MVKRFVGLAAALLFSLAAQAPGMYQGTWASGSSGNSGKLSLAFTDSGLAAASFTLEGQEVVTKPISSKPSESGLDFTFEYDVGGTRLRSRMQGKPEGKTLKGKYQSSPAEGGSPVDEGTWEATLR